MKTIKKISIIFTILLCLVISMLSLTACGDTSNENNVSKNDAGKDDVSKNDAGKDDLYKNVAVENVVLDKTEAIIRVEETLQLIGTVIPNNATNSTISWKSSDFSIATVSATGLVKAVGEGTCTITASADGKVAFCVVTIKKKTPDLLALYNALSNTYGWTIGDDGSYLSADSNVLNLDEYSNSTILFEIQDMNKKLGLPDSLWNDMLHTTWSMGKQEETYENIGIKVSWTYHPDKGLEVTYKLLG